MNKNPKFGKCENTPFHFIAFHGLSDVADFMIEELQVSEDCLCGFRNHHGYCYSRYYHGYCHYSLIPNNRGDTPLHNMTISGHAEIIRSLRRKLDFELIDPKLFNRIILAALSYGNLDCIKALLEKQTSSFQRNAVDTVKNYYSKNDFWMNLNYYKIVLYLKKDFIGRALYLIFPVIVIVLSATFIL